MDGKQYAAEVSTPGGDPHTKQTGMPGWGLPYEIDGDEKFEFFVSRICQKNSFIRLTV